MCFGLTESQLRDVNERLIPLLAGRPVTVLVRDPKLKKKRRIGSPVLFITPTECYGLGEDSLVFALQGYGCEVMRKGQVKAEYLYRMGLTMGASKLLTTLLNKMWSK